jgi:hypothetical protein
MAFYICGDFAAQLIGIVWVGRAYGRAYRACDFFKKSRGLVVFLGGIALLVCVRLTEV